MQKTPPHSLVQYNQTRSQSRFLRSQKWASPRALTELKDPYNCSCEIPRGIEHKTKSTLEPVKTNNGLIAGLIIFSLIDILLTYLIYRTLFRATKKALQVTPLAKASPEPNETESIRRKTSLLTQSDLPRLSHQELIDQLQVSRITQQTIRDWKQAAKQDPSLIDKFWTIIEDSKTNPDAAHASDFSISILNACHISFEGRDLSHIKIPGAFLPRVNFKNTNLTGADIRFVQSENGNWHGSILNQAKTEGLILEYGDIHPHTSAISCANHHHNLVISYYPDHEFCIWNTATKTEHWLTVPMSSRAPVSGLSLTPDAKTLIIQHTDQHTFTILNIESLESHTLSISEHIITDIVPIDNAKFITFGQYDKTSPHKLTLPNFDTGEPIYELQLQGKVYLSKLMNTNELYIVQALPDNTVDSSQLHQKMLHKLSIVKISTPPVQAAPLLTLDKHTILLPEKATAFTKIPEPERPLETKTSLHTLTKPTNTLLAVAFESKEMVHLYDLGIQPYRKKGKIKGTTNVEQLEFSPNGKLLYMAHNDGTLSIHSLTTIDANIKSRKRKTQILKGKTLPEYAQTSKLTVRTIGKLKSPLYLGQIRYISADQSKLLLQDTSGHSKRIAITEILTYRTQSEYPSLLDVKNISISGASDLPLRSKTIISQQNPQLSHSSSKSELSYRSLESIKSGDSFSTIRSISQKSVSSDDDDSSNNESNHSVQQSAAATRRPKSEEQRRQTVTRRDSSSSDGSSEKLPKTLKRPATRGSDREAMREPDDSDDHAIRHYNSDLPDWGELDWENMSISPLVSSDGEESYAAIVQEIIRANLSDAEASSRVSTPSSLVTRPAQRVTSSGPSNSSHRAEDDNFEFEIEAYLEDQKRKLLSINPTFLEDI